MLVSSSGSVVAFHRGLRDARKKQGRGRSATGGVWLAGAATYVIRVASSDLLLWQQPERALKQLGKAQRAHLLS